MGGTDQVDAAVFAGFDYVALGHLHSPQRVGAETIRYCGTPLKYSFSEAAQQKSVTIVELGPKGAVTVSAADAQTGAAGAAGNLRGTDGPQTVCGDRNRRLPAYYAAG